MPIKRPKPGEHVLKLSQVKALTGQGVSHLPKVTLDPIFVDKNVAARISALTTLLHGGSFHLRPVCFAKQTSSASEPPPNHFCARRHPLSRLAGWGRCSVILNARFWLVCPVDGMSKRKAARHFEIDRKTATKTLAHSLLSGYRRDDPCPQSVRPMV